MNIFDERIKALQRRMLQDGLKAYIIKASDPHLSESYADHYGAMRKYFCSFTGQDGTLLVTCDDYYLYTDGRYFVQAEIELKNTSCILMKEGTKECLPLNEFIKKNELYPLGLDSSLFSLDEIKSFYLDDNHKIISINYDDMYSSIPLPKGKIFKIPDEYFSVTRKERISSLLNSAKKSGADSLLLTSLEDIAFALSYRGSDIACTPVFYSYLFIDKDESLTLFIDLDKIPENFDNDIDVLPYEEVYNFLNSREDKIAVDKSLANAKIVNHIKNPLFIVSPAYLAKAIKGPVEIENIKRVHVLDGIAVLKLFKYLRDNFRKVELDEKKIADYIDATRLLNKECFSLSFETIAALDSNASMMHYAPSEDKFATLKDDSQLVLVDSGGQYFGGTTDITRTFLLQEQPSKEIIHDYTLTLKSHLNMMMTTFMKGCSGRALDIKAREVMWKEGLDYKCGTGHGVSYMLGVHEGPIGLRYYTRPNIKDDYPLEVGNIVTDEPGVYKDYKYGIRIENELLVIKDKSTDQGEFLTFETVTYCPYDKRGIDVDMLTDEELTFLNNYHKLVYDKLSPQIRDQKLLAFLKDCTSPLEK